MGGMLFCCCLSDDTEELDPERQQQIDNLWHFFRRQTTWQQLNDEVYTAEDEALFSDILDRLEQYDELRSNSDTSSEVGSVSSHKGVQSHDLFPIDATRLPPLEEWELTSAWRLLQRRQMPSKNIAIRLLQGVTEIYYTNSSVVHVERPMVGQKFIIVGDLHGHFADMRRILHEYGEPDAGPGGTVYLFNGDFVDRGKWGPEVLLSIYCLKLLHPKAVHLNRGNHEDVTQNRVPSNGFRHDHLVRAFDEDAEEMYSHCWRSFQQLPLVHIVGNQVAVVHGGISLDTGVTLAEIAAVDRKRECPTRLYTICGYKCGQRVMAKKDLRSPWGVQIPKGSIGFLVNKKPRTNRASVNFDICRQENVTVVLVGTPELEDEVEICFESEEDRRTQRSDRIFQAMLWSDPTSEDGASTMPCANFSRGAGSYFDEVATEQFLKANALQCLVRSHQKRAQGCCEEHFSSTGALVTATVFSASNYPGGTPDGNKASVIIVRASSNSGLLKVGVMNNLAWREDYDQKGWWALERASTSMLNLVSQQAKKEESRLPSARALQQLRLMVYCARPALLKFFHQLDQTASGMVRFAEWVLAMRACIIPDNDFPWEKVGRHLCTLDAKGCCYYPAFLARYRNDLAGRLERYLCASAFSTLHTSLNGVDGAAQIWSTLDRDNNGQLSYQELWPLIRSRCGFERDIVGTVDDRAYTVLASMDVGNSGFVDRDEFLRAIARQHSRPTTPSASIYSDLNANAVERCWAALHGVMRSLASAHCETEAVFRAMDVSKTGSLSRTEFKSGMKKLLDKSDFVENISQWEPLMWRLMDEDGNGSISLRELVDALIVIDTKQQQECAREQTESSCPPSSETS